MPDAWDPDQYHRFQADRARPFHDLLALLQPVEGPTVVDLGCGTGELTAALHDATGARATTGLDRSPAMLERARAHATGTLRFVEGDIGDFTGSGELDVVFANASLQWVPDHRAVLARWTAALGPGGQLAVQVPANADHPSHVVAQQVATELLDEPPPDPVWSVLPPEAYAELLDDLGYTDQHVRLQVYGARLASSAEVVEWVKGTNLTRFQSRMAPDRFEAFLAEYRTRLLAVLGDRTPYFYAFKRILLWGRRP